MVKTIIIAIFDIRGIVYVHWIPEDQTVDQHYYIEVLTVLRERARRRRPDLWKTKSWKIHQDNAPAHSALSVKAFIAKYGITVLEYPPYSPDLVASEGDKIRKCGSGYIKSDGGSEPADRSGLPALLVTMEKLYGAEYIEDKKVATPIVKGRIKWNSCIFQVTKKWNTPVSMKTVAHPEQLCIEKKESVDAAKKEQKSYSTDPDHHPNLYEVWLLNNRTDAATSV
ncbi:hypothetical protein NQ318_005986 [Aromia moschata]|uniref:Transposase n=1 Tax=Aromia moschata TaxID=1265417 RepID=A0AAV8Y0T4_9CUCU|nr:hypothetical protein NQ318_005986 [Aromia moschata]